MLSAIPEAVNIVRQTWDDVQKWHIDNPIYIDYPSIYTKANAHYALPKKSDPHKPILHASYCLIMTTQFTVAAILAIIKQKLCSELLPIASEPLSVLRRRLIIQNIAMSFHTSIGDPIIELDGKIEKITSKFVKHKLIFLDVNVEVSKGAYQVKFGYVVNFRDPLI